MASINVSGSSTRAASATARRRMCTFGSWMAPISASSIDPAMLAPAADFESSITAAHPPCHVEFRVSVKARLVPRRRDLLRRRLLIAERLDELLERRGLIGEAHGCVPELLHRDQVL